MSRRARLYRWRFEETPAAWRVFGRSGVLSVFAHVVAIAAAVRATEMAAAPYAASAVQAMMLRLVNRVPSDAVRPERTRFVSLSYTAADADATTTTRRANAGDGDRSALRPTPIPIAAEPSDDHLYTIYQVESTAESLESNEGPIYPPELVRARIEGAVLAQYVVDTTGFASAEDVAILESPDPRFSHSVRAALVSMRFRPATIDGRPVRQLVEQRFTFRLAADTAKPTILGRHASVP